MNALSVFAGVLLFFACALVGMWLRKRCVRKALFYEEYYEFLLFALEKISYERMPVSEIKAGFHKGEKTDFCEFLMGKPVALPIPDGEIAEIGEYIGGIGTTDADTQIASLRGKCAELKRFTEERGVSFKKDGSLYFKLSVLIGIACFIIIV